MMLLWDCLVEGLGQWRVLGLFDIEADGHTLVLTKPQPDVLRIFVIIGLTEMFSPAPI